LTETFPRTATMKIKRETLATLLRAQVSAPTPL